MMGVDPEIVHLHNDMVQRVSHGDMVGLGVTWWPGSSYVHGATPHACMYMSHTTCMYVHGVTPHASQDKK